MIDRPRLKLMTI